MNSNLSSTLCRESNRSVEVEAILHLHLYVYKKSELKESQNHKAFGVFMI